MNNKSIFLSILFFMLLFTSSFFVSAEFDAKNNEFAEEDRVMQSFFDEVDRLVDEQNMENLAISAEPATEDEAITSEEIPTPEEESKTTPKIDSEPEEKPVIAPIEGEKSNMIYYLAGALTLLILFFAIMFLRGRNN